MANLNDLQTTFFGSGNFNDAASAYFAGVNGYDPSRITPPVPPPKTVITTFQAGHGFTASGAGSSNLNDTNDFMLGTQSAQLTSNGAGASAQLSKTGMAAIDATGCYAMVWVKVDDWTHLNGLTLYLGDTGLTNRFAWNIKMNNQAFPYALAGEWVPFKFSFATATTTGAPNRAAITDARVFHSDDSVAAVTVHWNGIALVKDPATAWPNGVVSLTFDDSLASQFTVAKPILDAFGYSATAYTICSNVGGSGGVTLSQLQQMQDYSGWEIAAHAYTDANHTATYTGITTDALEQDTRLSKQWLKSNGFRGYDHCAYPLGAYNASVLAIMKKYYTSVRTIFQQQRETYPANDNMRLRVGYITNVTALATVEGWVDAAFTNREWLILVNHKLVNPATNSTDWLPADYTSLIAYINTKGIPVRTVGDVLRSGAPG